MGANETLRCLTASALLWMSTIPGVFATGCVVPGSRVVAAGVSADFSDIRDDVVTQIEFRLENTVTSVV